MSKPSLTPFRDEVERVLAQLPRPSGEDDHWLNRVQQRVTFELHRAMADECDLGLVRNEDVVAMMPRILRALAMNCAATSNVREDLIPRVTLWMLKVAMTDISAPDRVEQFIGRAADHGRA
jgi:hypothetical protein